METQTIVVMLIVLAAAAYVARLFWRAIKGTRGGVDAAGGCATGGCGCAGTEPEHGRAALQGIEAKPRTSSRR